MTREEAICELQSLYVYMSQWIGSYEDAKRRNDAITMAINALKTGEVLFHTGTGETEKMDEYITKHAAITVVGEAIADGESWFDALCDFPPADVRPVVFCKSCRKAKTDTIDGAIYCEVWDRWEMPPNAYCSYGRPKETTTRTQEGT